MIKISQKTISNKINCSGIGLHTGSNINISLLPAPIDSGIVFRRVDLDKEIATVPAKYNLVTTTQLGTTIANGAGGSVATIEHLMAAIWGAAIDNLIIEIDGSEVPIMDGSSNPFVFLLECAGVLLQDAPRRVIEITKEINVSDGDKFVTVQPFSHFCAQLTVDFSEKFPAQIFAFDSEINSFKNDIASARTFCFEQEIEYMRNVGLVKGGSLDNAIVIGDNGEILNEGGFRYKDELVRHKMIDFIGDMYLAGHFILGKFKAFKTGHSLNNKLIHKIISDPTNWRFV